jgi:hypothetical protein
MRFPLIKAIYLREMLDMFRDRRTMISMVAVPVLVFPLLFKVMTKVTGDIEKNAAAEARTLASKRPWKSWGCQSAKKTTFGLRSRRRKLRPPLRKCQAHRRNCEFTWIARIRLRHRLATASEPH